MNNSFGLTPSVARSMLSLKVRKILRTKRVNISMHLKSDLQNLLSVLVGFNQRHGRAPLLKEVLEGETVPDTTTRSRLTNLADKNLICFEGSGHTKTVRLTEDGHFALRTGLMPQEMPYFKSGLHAGSREVECDDDRRYINSLADLLPIDDASMTYFAPVVGHCMDAGLQGITRDGRRAAPEGADVMLRKCGRFSRPKNGQAVHVVVTIRSSGETVDLLRDYYFDERRCSVTLVPRNPDFPVTLHNDTDVDPRGVLATIIINDDGEPSPGAREAVSGARRAFSLGITDRVVDVFGRDAQSQNELTEASR